MDELNIKVNCHSSICLNNDIYIDPLNICDKLYNAKIVFITHSHWDHFDIKSINNIRNVNTIFVCPIDCKEALIDEGVIRENILVVEPNKKYNLLDIEFETFASYNKWKKFHSKGNNWVGYTILINNIKYTVCGDTDVTDELIEQKTDVLFVPIGGTYTMDAVDASFITNIIKPQLVIPVHYGEIVGGMEPEKIFISKLNKGIEYRLLIKN